MERTKKRAVFFTAIPKTGSTSLYETLFREIYPAEEVYRPNGYWSMLFDKHTSRYLGGHWPYGVHRLSARVGTPRYYTMLREPVERAISFYYECLWPRGDKKVADHPEHATAWRHDLVEFYRIPRFRNVQARMVAGLWADILGRYVSLDRMGMGTFVTSTAKRHLQEDYSAFGITERFGESRQWIADSLGVDVAPIEEKHKTNPDRPTAEDLTEDQRATLRRLNRLDVEIYEFALDLFDRRSR